MAVRFLAMKLRSEKEVSFKLENEGFDEDTIEKVLEELKSMGYINDKIYAQKYVYDRSKLKPKAKKMLSDWKASYIHTFCIEYLLTNTV
jgi:regulatory protein